MRTPEQPRYDQWLERAQAPGCRAAYLGSIPRAGDCVLIASELAANSVVHSGSQTFVMRCEVFSTCIWIESQDSGADWRPGQPDDRPHGTDLIDLLAEEWGTGRITQGDRITWARVAK